MKMSSNEFNEFKEMADAAFGAKVMLNIIEEYPSQLCDEEITALATTLKKIIRPVADYLQTEVRKQEGE